MSEQPSPDPQADADEAKFRHYMERRFRITMPPAAPTPPSPLPPSSLPDLHSGARANPSPGDDQKLEAYLQHFFPGQGRPAA